MSESGRDGVSPFLELDRTSWAALAGSAELPLDAEDLARLRTLGDEVGLDEVRDVYLPLSQLLSMHVRHAADLHRSTEEFLGRPQPQRTPFVIAVAGSVAVGKSTTARLLCELLRRWPQHPRVSLVTTDGFLLPNAELARQGLLERKGFPESYDRRALLRFLIDVKSGVEAVDAPVYSHLAYDVTDEHVSIEQPDIVVLEGLTVLQPAPIRGDGRPGLAVSDFFDFSVYVDAAAGDIRAWYVRRFLQLRETAFRDPRSYFTRYAALTSEEATELAGQLWDTINGPNLRENIAPTRGRASVVLRKDADHSVRRVRLRKL
jgi:type I pantothenate kinase